jgi:hypothetical protein
MSWDLISNFPNVTELEGDRVHEQAQEEFDYKVHACSWSLRNTPVANQDSPPPPRASSLLPLLLSCLELYHFCLSSPRLPCLLSLIFTPPSLPPSKPVGISLIQSTSAWLEATACPASRPAYPHAHPTPSRLASRTSRVRHHDPRASLYSVSRYLLCTTMLRHWAYGRRQTEKKCLPCRIVERGRQSV